MSDQARRLVFALTAGWVVITLVVLSLLGTGSDGPAQQEVTGDQRRHIFGGSGTGGRSSRPRMEGRDAPAIDPSHLEDLPARPSEQIRRRARAVKTSARRFLDALLRYETEGPSAPVRRAIRRVASPALADQITGRGPRGSAASASSGQRGDPRLVQLEPETVGSAEAVATAMIERAGRKTALVLTLRRGPAGWLVTDLA